MQQSNPTPAVPAEQPASPASQLKLCAYAACGREFVPTHGSQKYCSSEHRLKANNNELAAARRRKKRTPKPCVYCGREFVSTGKRQTLYCSTECTVNAWRRRQLAVVVAGFLERHTCHADCPCSKLSHIPLIAQEFERRSAVSTQRWNDPEMAQLMTHLMTEAINDPGVLQRKSEIMTNLWNDPVVSHRIIDGMNRPEVSQAKSKANKERWSNPEEARLLSEAIKKGLEPAEVRQRMSEGIKASWTPELRQQKSEDATNWWADQKRKLAAADRVLATRGGGKEKDIADRTYFEIGLKVEKERPTFKSIYALPRQKRTRANLLKNGFSQPHIDAAIASNNELIAARRFVAWLTTTKPPVLSYPTVAEYHRQYLAELRLGLPSSSDLAS